MRKPSLAKWILIAAAIAGIGRAQSLEFSKLFVEAESLMEVKKYDEALAGYSKAFSRALSKDEKALSLWRIAQVQKALGHDDLYLEKLADSLKEAEIEDVRKEYLEAQGGSASTVTSADAVRDFIIRERRVDLQVLFVPGKSDLTSQGTDQTTELAKALQSEALASSRFLVVGHTDSTGSAELNLKLSIARAQTVMRKLVELGVSSERLSSEGKGKTELKINPERTAEDRAKNRRVEVKKIS